MGNPSILAANVKPGWPVTAKCGCFMTCLFHEAHSIDEFVGVAFRIERPCNKSKFCPYLPEERDGLRYARVGQRTAFTYDPLVCGLIDAYDA